VREGDESLSFPSLKGKEGRGVSFGEWCDSITVDKDYIILPRDYVPDRITKICFHQKLTCINSVPAYNNSKSPHTSLEKSVVFCNILISEKTFALIFKRTKK